MPSDSMRVIMINQKITNHDCDDAEDHYPFVFFYHEVYDCVVYVEVPIDPSFLYHQSVGHGVVVDDDDDAVYSYDLHAVLDHQSQVMEDYFFLQSHF